MGTSKRALGIIGTAIIIWFGLFAPAVFAGIPEPSMILYGQVYDDSGVLVTSGELTWTFRLSEGEDPVVALSTQLSEIQGPGGPFSYKVLIPLETEVSGHPSSENTIPLSTTPVEYIREAELTGTEIGLQDTVTISMTDRGTVEYVPINSSALSDTDGDGLPDDLEQQIIDDDPNDGIVDYGDVLPGGDYDGDGESNQFEYDNGTDPTDARSANSVENVYATFHFEIFREAEQTAAGVFEPLSWGVELLCWPREGHEITSGSLTKPSGTIGASTVDLDITGEGDEAEYWKDDYSSLSELMDDMVGGTYRVHLQVASGVTATYDLRCKLNVPSYGPADFPDYVRIEKPAPSAKRVSTTPLLDFDTSTWDYVEIFEAHSGEETYFHYRSAEDDPADTHQITKEYALPPGRHLLGVDVNHGGSSWLGSKTAIEIITQGNVVTPWQMLLLGD